MRALQIFLVVIALVAVGVAGWALGSRGGYGQPDAGPATGSHTSRPASEPTRRPEIRSISTIPFAPHIGGALHLPPGPGRVTFRVRIDNASRTQFWLARGTRVDKTAIWLGEDSDGANGWSVGMRYDEDGFLDNLIIRANGPGGTTEEFVGVTNNGGAGATEEVADEDAKATS